MAFIIQTALFLAYVTPRLEPTQLEAGVVEIEPTPPPHQPTCPLSTHELEDQRTALTSLDVPIAACCSTPAPLQLISRSCAVLPPLDVPIAACCSTPALAAVP